MLIGKAIPKTLVYWAPELLKLEQYDFRVDLWSLGVSIYQMVTGEHPFKMETEEKFRENVLSAAVDWSRLESAPRLKRVIENLLQPLPERRWTAQQVLTFCQHDFAVDLQRVWRGFYQRKEFKRQCRALIKIQSCVKGYLTRIHYQRDRMICRENAAIMVQKTFRSYARRKRFLKERRALMVCQANVLCRQMRRAYNKMKLDVTTAQAYIRRYLSVSWFKKITSKKEELINIKDGIDDLIRKYDLEAKAFRIVFPRGKISGPLRYLESFEEYEIHNAKTYGNEKTVIPRVAQIQTEVTKKDEMIAMLNKKVEEEQRKGMMADKNDEEMKRNLGPKYSDFKPMVDEVKKNLVRLAEMTKKAMNLHLKMARDYQYTKWDQIHEPYNVVENVLRNDDSVYKALNPVFDFTLNNSSSCFISEVIIFPGDVGPAAVEILVGNISDKWTFVREFKCTRESEQHFVLPGEQIAKLLRVKCTNNIRGGNIVSMRHIIIRGIPKDQ